MAAPPRQCNPEPLGGSSQPCSVYFEFEALGATWRTEVLAGFTTLITMAYIAFLNPSILSQRGMPVTAVAAATCFSAGAGSLLMGVLARYPIALAPGRLLTVPPKFAGRVTPHQMLDFTEMDVERNVLG